MAVSTTFMDLYDRAGAYYIKGNPWKVSYSNSYQKIFRNCVVCGDERFNSDAWKDLHRIHLSGDTPTTCRKLECYRAIDHMWGVVDAKYLLVKTERDRAHVQRFPEQESYEEVGLVTITQRPCDKVYPNENEIPKLYIDTIQPLEQINAGFRITKIDKVYFDYIKKTGIKSDPFLQMLREYREKTVAISIRLEKQGY